MVKRTVLFYIHRCTLVHCQNQAKKDKIRKTVVFFDNSGLNGRRAAARGRGKARSFGISASRGVNGAGMYQSVQIKKSAKRVSDKSADGWAILAAIQSDIRRSVALGASLNARDPIWHLTETFTTVFNTAGRGLTDELLEPAENDGAGFAARPGEEAEEAPPAGDKWDFSKHYEPSPLQKQSGLFLRKFGKTAFDGGSLAAGILQGQSRYMLTSCLKRSLGQSEPANAKQEKLFGGSSVHKNLPRNEAQVIFNRNDVKSAVGIVVGSLRSAGRVFETLVQAAESEDSPLVRENVETLRQLYPFLTVERDRKTLDRYREKLKSLREQGAEPELLSMLERSIAKLQAVIDKKTEMKTQFMTKLREYGENAIGAEALFSQPEFIDEVCRELTAAASGDGDDEGRKDRRETAGQSKQEETRVSEERSDEPAPAWEKPYGEES